MKGNPEERILRPKQNRSALTARLGPSFRPQVDVLSATIDSRKSHSDGKRWAELYSLGSKQDRVLALKKAQLEEARRREDENFPYKPQLCGRSSDKAADVDALNERMREWSQARDAKVQEAARTMQERAERNCTFRPQVLPGGEGARHVRSRSNAEASSSTSRSGRKPMVGCVSDRCV